MILRGPLFDRAYERLGSRDRHRVDQAIERLQRSFGHPHEHGSLGIRPIGHFFECRAGLHLRALFVARSGDLVLITVGNHDTIRAYMKANS